MVQELIIGVAFAGAAGYLGRLGWQQFAARSQAGCAKGCGSCGAIDFSKIEQQLQAGKKAEQPAGK